MKKAEISFRVIGESGPLAISWFPGPHGDAIEARNQAGVGFFSPNGELLAVEFDDVREKRDHQTLVFDRFRVEVTTKSGKVSYSVSPISKGTSRKKLKSPTLKKVA